MSIHAIEGGRATRAIAQRYLERGWVPIPVKHGEKKPGISAWQTMTLEEAKNALDINFPKGRTSNIGVLTGPNSNHLVDVDLDDPVAVKLAPRFLPPTATFGRISNPGSHYLYVCEIQTQKFQASQMVAEIRAGGCQTVFPGSTHTSGESIDWEGDSEPVAIGADELAQAVTDLCVTTAFVEIWPAAGTGGRHEAAMGLAGVLRNAKITRQRAVRILDAVCECVSDPEKRDRLRALDDTYEADTVKAWSAFLSIDPLVKRAINSWLRQVTDGASDNAVHVSLGLSDEALYNTTLDAMVAALRVYRMGELLVGVAGAKTHIFTGNTIRMRLSPPVVFTKAGKDGTAVPTSPPPHVLRNLCEWPAPARVPEITAISDIPIIRPDGSMHTLPGHDAETGIYYVAPAAPVVIPTCDVDAALDTLIAPFQEFPWASGTYLSSFIAAILTVLLRGTYEGRPPALLIDKNSAGAGATLLGQCLGILATGDDAPIHLPDSNEETTKRIHVAVLQSDPIIFLDNVRLVGGQFLDALLTSKRVTIRILGQSKSSTVNFRSLVIATGNNLQINGDLARRVYRIRLDHPDERPQDADHKIKDLSGHVRKNRAKLVGAALRLAQLWFEACQPHHGGRELGGFEAWSRVVRSIVRFSGLEDPMNSVKDMIDPSAEALVQFLENAPTSKFTASELYELTQLGPGQRDDRGNALNSAILALMYPTLPHHFTSVAIGMRIAEYIAKKTAAGTLRRGRSSKGTTYWVEK